jgi:hypothetical protein
MVRPSVEVATAPFLPHGRSVTNALDISAPPATCGRRSHRSGAAGGRGSSRPSPLSSSDRRKHRNPSNERPGPVEGRSLAPALGHMAVGAQHERPLRDQFDDVEPGLGLRRPDGDEGPDLDVVQLRDDPVALGPWPEEQPIDPAGRVPPGPSPPHLEQPGPDLRGWGVDGGGVVRVSAQSKLWKPALSWPICTRHGHTSEGGAIETDRVYTADASAAMASPGKCLRLLRRRGPPLLQPGPMQREGEPDDDRDHHRSGDRSSPPHRGSPLSNDRRGERRQEGRDLVADS